MVYRNATDSYMLIFYLATSLNLWISSNNFLAAFSKHKIMSSANRDNFISSFPIWIPFIFFLYRLTALARNPSTIWNMSGESGHPSLAPNLGEKAFNFSPLSVMLDVDL